MKPKIMLVDDDETILYAYKLSIEEIGFEVIIFSDADSAIEYLKNNKDIDLLIIDVMMPEKDGITAIKEITELQNDLPIIILTAYADWNIVKRDKELVKKHLLIQKPIDKTKLQHVVKIKLKHKI